MGANGLIAPHVSHTFPLTDYGVQGGVGGQVDAEDCWWLCGPTSSCFTVMSFPNISLCSDRGAKESFV
eukprot:NODE_13931_length_248_cov_17.683417_g13018_i0.p1 GENE.NODE_13931_length_248_cov_17.683417_g13018_i0~~NODE_13931_length_248_cov_17.683417_g13018_i0.p1  ORF type:complete len:79 (+),score=12.31 NODE_13931_length_248_cov_17.683417_g13018_i0:34-237(+)